MLCSLCSTVETPEEMDHSPAIEFDVSIPGSEVAASVIQSSGYKMLPKLNSSVIGDDAVRGWVNCTAITLIFAPQ